jgi:hypothetical protein
MIKAVVLMLGALLLAPLAGSAQFTQQQGYQYVIKFICGEADQWDAIGGDIDGDGIVDFGQHIAPGTYHTVINVLNTKTTPVRMFKKIALDGYDRPDEFDAANDLDGVFEDNPGDRPRFLYQVPGPVFFVNIDDDLITPPLDPQFDTAKRFFSLTPVTYELSAREAFQVNCAEIRAVVNDYTYDPTGLLPRADADDPDPPDIPEINDEGHFGRSFLIKGYFVIYSREKLDITAIYTACEDTDLEDAVTDPQDCESFSSLDIEEIEENVVAPPTIPEGTTTTALSLSQSGGELRLSVRPSRLSAISEARLLVFNTEGRLLHDSGFAPTGQQLRWRPLSADGRPLANGVYLYAVMVRDVFGRVGTQIGKFAWVR